MLYVAACACAGVQPLSAWEGGSFAQSHMPTALYMYFHNGVIQKYFPGYDYTLPP